MNRLSDVQIANVAYAAGFRGDGLVIAVAVSLGESGGDADAYNSLGYRENSHGLWQINIDPAASPQYANYNLNDPLTNANAAFTISSGGINWNPWGSFTMGTYTRFLDRARAAVAQATGSSFSGGIPGVGGIAAGSAGFPWGWVIAGILVIAVVS